jgi:polyferredoxin
MEWYLVVMAVGLLGFAGGLSIGLWMPRNLATDIVMNYFLLIAIFIFTLVGIIALAYGLRR